MAGRPDSNFSHRSNTNPMKISPIGGADSKFASSSTHSAEPISGLGRTDRGKPLYHGGEISDHFDSSLTHEINSLKDEQPLDLEEKCQPFNKAKKS